MFTIYYEVKGHVWMIENIMADSLSVTEEIIGRCAMILMVEKQP